jgi:hypothetical protein
MSYPGAPTGSLTVTGATALSLFLGACGPTASEEIVPEATSGYSPFEASYEGVTRARIEQTYNYQTDVNEIGMRYHVTVDVVGADSGLNATLVLDSITDVSGIPAGHIGERTDSARGTTYSGMLAPSGELLGFRGGAGGGSLARELAERVLASFFPRIPATGTRPGAHWADTLETTASLGGVNNTVQSLREHRATEWTTYVGRRALLIVTSSTYTFSGSGVQVGQEFTLEGRGRRHSHFYLRPDGMFLGFIAADTADATAYLTEAGITIPVHQTRADTLALVR